MSRCFLTAILLFNIFFTCIAQSPPTNITNGINTLFQDHVNQTKGLVPGHVIRIEKPGSWIYKNSAGLSSLNPEVNMQPDMKFKIASITKLFTTVAIFKLIEEGKIKFDAPIESYLPIKTIQGFDNYQNIKVKNLLNHTSGIRDPQNDFQERLNFWIYMKRFEEIPIDSLIFWSYAAPYGVGNYSYSNSNFYLLAEIIKSVSGDSYNDFITKNIINPLGLKNTDFKTIPNGSFMRGYLKGSFYGTDIVLPQNIGLKTDSIYDFTEASNSWGYGAADIWSNTSDLILFLKALFEGELIKKNWLDTMKTVVTNTGDMGSYGHGMIQFKSFNGGPIYALGHTGSAFGYGSTLCYIPSLDIYICSAGNYMKIGQEFLQRDIYNFLNNNISSTTEIDFNNSTHIYPNPVLNSININTTLFNFQVSLYNQTGQIVFDKKNISTFDISDLPKGIYLLKLQDLNIGNFVMKKLIHE
jgi:D-alanyl-D-alanine carboxypeptidase